MLVEARLRRSVDIVAALGFGVYALSGRWVANRYEAICCVTSGGRGVKWSRAWSCPWLEVVRSILDMLGDTDTLFC